ncbi:MAG TPA: threonine--tRNA ligase [Candidatus Saccharimonadales bacterium]|nr:threonine--tRNA ligase [Candidatus Saccharimonadales bacterium]
MANNNPDDHIKSVRHSLAHLLAATVTELYPGAKNSIGPAVENGFYQDFETPNPISDEELPKIEAAMREKLKTWQNFTRKEVSPDEARKVFDWNPYKLELIDDFAKEDKQITLYTSGTFVDLCRGGHVENASEINPKAFKLTAVSGAYWRGDQTKQQLQRIYGVAFETEDELKKYLQMMEEAKKRDHRKLGQELDLFVISDIVGSGLPLFTPRGTVLREELGRYTQEIRSKRGFERVWTPNIAKTDLYKASGHWDKFGDELFLVKSQETNDEFVLRPMNCPHHIQIYASQPRSYKQLPIKYMENAGDFRDEKTGELHGLSRVRSMTQDDSHAFVREDQIGQVASEVVDAAQEMYSQLDMKLKFRLSFRDDGDGYLGDMALWQRAQGMIEDLAKENKLDYFIAEGEAAFYGPKIDFMATDALGREWQVATVQIDFVLPQRFELEYSTADGGVAQPVMVHCALLGTIERFLSVYIEHTGGKFPIWNAPEQIRLATVNQEYQTNEFADKILAQAKELGLRVNLDNSNESVGKKIRNAELMKVPFTVVIGEKEIETGELMPRIRKDLEVNEKHEPHTVEEFLKSVANDAKSRVSKTSL